MAHPRTLHAEVTLLITIMILAFAHGRLINDYRRRTAGDYAYDEPSQSLWEPSSPNRRVVAAQNYKKRQAAELPSTPSFDGYGLSEMEVALAKSLYQSILPELRRAVEGRMDRVVSTYEQALINGLPFPPPQLRNEYGGVGGAPGIDFGSFMEPETRGSEEGIAQPPAMNGFPPGYPVILIPHPGDDSHPPLPPWLDPNQMQGHPNPEPIPASYPQQGPPQPGLQPNQQPPQHSPPYLQPGLQPNQQRPPQASPPHQSNAPTVPQQQGPSNQPTLPFQQYPSPSQQQRPRNQQSPPNWHQQQPQNRNQQPPPGPMKQPGMSPPRPPNKGY